MRTMDSNAFKVINPESCLVIIVLEQPAIRLQQTFLQTEFPLRSYRRKYIFMGISELQFINTQILAKV